MGAMIIASGRPRKQRPDYVRAYSSQAARVARLAVLGRWRAPEVDKLCQLAVEMFGAISLDGELPPLQSCLSPLPVAARQLAAVIGVVLRHPELINSFWQKHVEFCRVIAAYPWEISPPPPKPKRVKRKPGCNPELDDAVACVRRQGGLKPDQTARDFLDLQWIKESFPQLIRASGLKMEQVSQLYLALGYIDEHSEGEAAEAIVSRKHSRFFKGVLEESYSPDRLYEYAEEVEEASKVGVPVAVFQSLGYVPF